MRLGEDEANASEAGVNGAGAGCLAGVNGAVGDELYGDDTCGDELYGDDPDGDDPDGEERTGQGIYSEENTSSMRVRLADGVECAAQISMELDLNGHAYRVESARCRKTRVLRTDGKTVCGREGGLYAQVVKRTACTMLNRI